MNVAGPVPELQGERKGMQEDLAPQQSPWQLVDPGVKLDTCNCVCLYKMLCIKLFIKVMLCIKLFQLPCT